MFNEYSLWSNNNFDSNLPEDFPFATTRKIVAENSLFLDKVAESSRLDALQMWCAAVSGARFCPPNDEAAQMGGLDSQPYWDFKAYNTYGFTKQQAEDVTNFHDAYTGYMLFMDSFTAVGINENLADSLSRITMYMLSGGYQLINDIRTSRFFSVDHTIWGEEVKDVPYLKAGMDYGEFIRRSREAENVGVYLNEREFGFSKYGYEKSTLGIDIPWQEYERFNRENEETLKRWEEERHQHNYDSDPNDDVDDDDIDDDDIDDDDIDDDVDDDSF